MLLALTLAPPPVVDVTPDAEMRAQAKINRFRATAKSGQLRTLRMTEAELNGWIQSRLPQRKTAWTRKGSETPESLQDLRVQLLERTMRAYAAFEVHGKEMSLELEGRPSARDGRLRLELSTGKLGALPLPAPACESAAGRVFDALQGSEKILPVQGIVDVRVERFELVITTR
jgi:hypothetical protein